jgi:hypothetical protein
MYGGAGNAPAVLFSFLFSFSFVSFFFLLFSFSFFFSQTKEDITGAITRCGLMRVSIWTERDDK